MDLTTHIQSLKDLYQSDNQNRRLRALIYGDKGTGKTTLLATARKPVYIQSFDPGGPLLPCIQAGVESGDIIVDSSWELLTDTSKVNGKFVMEAWLEHMVYLEKIDLFSKIGTFAMDSLTFWSEHLMADIIRRDPKNTSGIPQIQSYVPYQYQFVNIMKQFQDKPCDVIVVGHIAKVEDPVKGGKQTGLNLIGAKTSGKVLAAFSELWCLKKTHDSKGSKVELLTQGDHYYDASTRIGSGKLSASEVPNISAMLKKCGWDASRREVKE